MNDSARRVNVVLDATLMTHDTINCHPLVNTMTTSISRGDLVRFLDATGHRPDHGGRGPRSGPTRTLTDRIANTPLTPSNWADIQLRRLRFGAAPVRQRRRVRCKDR